MKFKLCPSILSADFGKLNEEIKEIEKYSDMLHIDVMDGHFVPNLSFGLPVVAKIKTKLPMDCHLMISDPLKYGPGFARYCRRISFHPELFNDTLLLKKAIVSLKSEGVEIGLALNPDKPIDIILPVLDKIDFVLVMSVYAGFAGQEFIPEVLDKIKSLRKDHGFRKDIAIDGGIDKKTILLAKEAGANVFVAGSAIFGKKDRKKAIAELRGALS